MGYKRTSIEWRALKTQFVEQPFAFVKTQLATGDASPSFTSFLLDKAKHEEFLMKEVAAIMFAGGADTTSSVLSTFFLAMTLYPSVLKRAQAEVDSVVGSDRFPSFSDKENLPYISAVMQESLRWGAVVPVGLPHLNSEEIIYAGYRIPKGASVLANIWYILHDPAVYHEPKEFNPDRFLSEGNRSPEQDPRSVLFGFGRRICPGKDFAANTIFLAVARSVWSFDILKARDAQGRVIEPSLEYVGGHLSQPKELRCSLTARSAKVAAIIENVKEELSWGNSDAEKLSGIRW